ncbi:hypothetical protein, partial [Brevibacterium rongguiense]|uniref:hypothetical protein n=1 Tax=Brevibacterium rongguiense TaxID=2695267 RepID=UPI001F3FC353
LVQVDGLPTELIGVVLPGHSPDHLASSSNCWIPRVQDPGSGPIQGNNGAVSQGENASAVMSGGGVSVPELINLISAVRSAVEDQPDLADSEIVGVVDTLSDELGLAEPDTAVVEDGRRRLATFLSETVARPGVTTAVSALVAALGQWVGLG